MRTPAQLNKPGFSRIGYPHRHGRFLFPVNLPAVPGVCARQQYRRAYFLFEARKHVFRPGKDSFPCRQTPIVR